MTGRLRLSNKTAPLVYFVCAACLFLLKTELVYLPALAELILRHNPIWTKSTIISDCCCNRDVDAIIIIIIVLREVALCPKIIITNSYSVPIDSISIK